MRVLIVGAGGLGTVLAGYLARGGAEVTLLVKPGRADAFERPEVHVLGADAIVAPVRLVSEAGRLGFHDFAAICVKGRDSESALAGLQPASFETILSLQNGVAKDDLLVQRFGRDRVLGAVTYVAGALERPGFARSSNPAPTFVGELDGRVSERAERFVAMVRAGGLPAATTADIAGLEWYKLAIFLRTALVSALTRLDVAELATRPALRRVCAAVALEVSRVAAAEGYRIPREALPEFSLAGPPAEDEPVDAVELPAAAFDRTLATLGDSLRRLGRTFYPSLAQDVMAGRPSELDATAGDVLARAGRLGMDLPVLSTCTNLLRGLDVSEESGPAATDQDP